MFFRSVILTSLITRLLAGNFLSGFFVFASQDSPYKLPYRAGQEYICTQGNNSNFSHHGKDKFAFDFNLPGGAEVVASRAGKVLYIKEDSSTGGGYKYRNEVNYVIIDHGDGTSALYIHLQHNSVMVEENQPVKQGQVIAQADTTGWCTASHLHFKVQETPQNRQNWYTQSIQISFSDSDVLHKEKDGTPREDRPYKSDNKLVEEETPTEEGNYEEATWSDYTLEGQREFTVKYSGSLWKLERPEEKVVVSLTHKTLGNCNAVLGDIWAPGPCSAVAASEGVCGHYQESQSEVVTLNSRKFDRTTDYFWVERDNTKEHTIDIIYSLQHEAIPVVFNVITDPDNYDKCIADFEEVLKTFEFVEKEGLKENSVGKTAQYPDVSIFYEHDDQIWQFNPRTDEKTKIDDGHSPSLSPDGTKLVYVYGHLGDPLNDQVKLLDLKNGSTKECFTGPGANITSWSPDSKYFIEDTGSDVIGRISIIDSIACNEVAHTGGYRIPPAWINNEEVVFLSFHRDVENFRTHPLGSPGISIFNINGQETILKKPTTTKHYLFLRLLDDGKIHFSSDEVSSIEDWTLDKITTTYWTMDKSGGDLAQIENEVGDLTIGIKKTLPLPYRDYEDLWGITPLHEDKNWITLVLNKTRDKREEEVFIMNVNNPDSIKKIGRGIRPTW